MRQGSIRLGRIFGVPLGMDPGVILIGGLLSWMLATSILPSAAPGLVGSVYWSVGVVGAVLFFGSLLAHEMAHAVVARRNDIEVVGITLWLFGGFAEFRSEPRTPGAEFRISAAGPAASLTVAVLFLGSAFGLSALGTPAVYTSLLGWLGVINGFLGVFNLLPGAPLDGGRVLASALWKVRGDRLAGRIGAATTGKVVGALIAGIGFAEIAFLGGYGGLWTVFIGWFIYNAARTEHAYFVGERALGDLRVRDAMHTHPQTVRTWTTIADLVEGPLRSTQQTAVPVLDWNGTPVGVLTMAQVARVPAEAWPTTEVAELLPPGAQVPVATLDQPVVDLVEQIAPMGSPTAVVVDDEGRLVGMIGPADISRAIELGRISGASRPRRTPPPPPVSAPTQRWEPPLHPR